MRLRNGTVATALIFFTSFLSLSWYTAWQNGKGKLDIYVISVIPPTPYKKMSEGSTVSRRGLVNKLAGRKLKHDQQAACLKTQQVKSPIPWNWFQRGNA